METSTASCSTTETSTVSCVGFMDRALALEQSGRSVIHLEKGELDFDTPEVVRRSAVAALDAGETRYADSRGLQPLREAICAYYAGVYGVTVSPERVLVTSGSSPALLAALLATTSAGQEVVLPDPGYPAYRTLVETAGGRPVAVSTEPDGFRVVAASMLRHVTPATAAVLVNTPSNPTGSILAAPELAELARSEVTVIADEVYEPLVFDDAQRRSILQHSGEAVVVNSFSKAFAMTGWRLGYVIVPDGLLDRFTRIIQDAYVGANAFVQRAAVTALEHADTIQSEWRATLQARRDALVRGVTALGFDVVVEPQGAFYVFAKLPEPHRDSAAFSLRLLDEAGVAVTPGREFGPSGEGCVRFSYSASTDAIAEGLGRIEDFLASYTERRQEACHGA